MGASRKITYEPEADVLSWEINEKQAIEYAREAGNVVVHYSNSNEPVLIEILNAKQFLETAEKALTETNKAE